MFPARFDAGCLLAAGQPVTVVSGATTGHVDFALRQGGRVVGRITDGLFGLPISGISVRLTGALGQSWDSTSTDAAGQFTLSGLHGGTYFLHTHEWRGYLNEVYDNVPCGAECTPSAGTPLAVVPGATIGGLEIVLQQGGRISGYVTDWTTGFPVRHGQVAAFDATGQRRHDASVDGNGAYVVTGLPPGQYFVQVSWTADEYLPELFRGLPCPGPACDVRDGTPVRVAVNATTQHVDFALTPLGNLSGRVTGADGSVPVRAAWVFVFDESSRYAGGALTDVEGRYSIARLPAGRYRVKTATYSDYVDEVFSDVSCGRGCSLEDATPVAVAGRSVTTVDFTLDSGGHIAGTVFDAETRHLLSNVTLDVFNAAGTAVATVVSSAAGTFASPGLPAGPYFVRAVPATPYSAQLFSGLPCPAGTCAVRLGTPVSVTTGETTSGIDFPLQTKAPPGPSVYYLAEGATGEFFDMDVVIANPNTVEAPVDLRFLVPGGGSILRRLTLGAQRRTTLRVNDVPLLASTAVSTVVTSTAGLPLVVERTMVWNHEGYGGHGDTAVTATGTRWHFAEGSQGFFDTYVLLANPGDVPATVRITFLREFDTPVEIRPQSPPARGRPSGRERWPSLRTGPSRCSSTPTSRLCASGPCTSAHAASGTADTTRRGRRRCPRPGSSRKARRATSSIPISSSATPATRRRT